MEGEEGVNKEFLPGNHDGTQGFNAKKFEKEIRQELAACKLDPKMHDRANQLENFVLKKDTWIDEALNAPDIPEDEIAFYPGSDKGPNPEDDPEHYSRWFFEHQPKSLYANQESPTYADIGVK